MDNAIINLYMCQDMCKFIYVEWLFEDRESSAPDDFGVINCSRDSNPDV